MQVCDWDAVGTRLASFRTDHEAEAMWVMDNTWLTGHGFGAFAALPAVDVVIESASKCLSYGRGARSPSDCVMVGV